MKRKFKVSFEGDVDLELDDAVIAAVDDDWRKTFYDLKDPEAIAEHIAFAMVIRGFLFKQLDGFAGLPDDAAKIGPDDFEVHAVEIKSKKAKGR